MARHLMVDLETLATSPDAVILTIGAVTFDPASNKIFDKLYYRVDVESCDRLGMTVNDDTVEWWSKQAADVQTEAFAEDNRVPIEEVIEKFHKFAWNCDAFWSHGATFDLVILDCYYRKLNKVPPWNFWQIRDTRTLFDLGYDPEMPKEGLHNALEDASRQAIGVQTIYRKLNRFFR
jgi:3' exoribonuclease, RNase T-like